ncbi:MAG: type II toxin-antitoxin system RelB/DinJ family antitoxin [Butyribacter sp.]|nr:type II toxin-antitoxin system RelB/DinJ family antitoxin [Butyribacter sp.]
MATKTANVTARIQPDIKESAEAILEKLGIPVSVFIDMTYRQVIANNGVPFALTMPRRVVARISDDKIPETDKKFLKHRKK